MGAAKRSLLERPQCRWCSQNLAFEEDAALKASLNYGLSAKGRTAKVGKVPAEKIVAHHRLWFTCEPQTVNFTVCNPSPYTVSPVVFNFH